MIHYLNLTNGIEGVSSLVNPKFVRIQSSHIESNQWDRLIYELDYNFLLDLARGFDVCLIDYTNHNTRPGKVIYHGIPIIKMVLESFWLSVYKRPMISGFKLSKQTCMDIAFSFTKPTRNKLKYLSKFCTTKTINLTGESLRTTLDGNYEVYSNLLHVDTINRMANDDI